LIEKQSALSLVIMEINQRLHAASCYETERLSMEEAKLPLLSSPQPNKWIQKISLRSFVVAGILVGIVDQAISVGSVIFMSKRWGTEPHPKTSWDMFLYIILSMLSRMDILMVAALSIAALIKLTERKFLQNLMGDQWTPQKAVRMECVFLAGIVLGSFFIWILVGMWMPLPFSTLVELSGVVVIDLLLFYYVIRCLFAWRDDENDPDDDPENIS
jgi:hypothetical protein